MNSWDKNRNDLIYKVKLQKVKSTMSKLFSPVNANAKVNANIVLKKKSPQIKKNSYEAMIKTKSKSLYAGFEEASNKRENFQEQKVLKKLLKDFGLQQYLRKFYELGYDDNNLHRLVSLNSKEFEEFVFLLKIYPGHKVRVIAFIEQLSRIFGNYARSSQSTRVNMRNTATANTTNTKRFHSVNSNRVSNYPLSGNTANKNTRQKPKSVGTLRTNNKILKSFVNGNGFGFNYYLNNKNEEFTDDENKNITKDTRDRESSGKTNPNTKTFNINEEHMNEEIDKLLNYYMAQLNDKMEDSFDSLVDDSSLENFASIQNLLNNNNIVKKNDHNNLGVDNNISEIKAKQGSPSNYINNSTSIQHMLDKNTSNSTSSKVDHPDKVHIGNNISSITHTHIQSVKGSSPINPPKSNDEADDDMEINYDFDDAIEEDIENDKKEDKPIEVKKQTPNNKTNNSIKDKEDKTNDKSIILDNKTIDKSVHNDKSFEKKDSPILNVSHKSNKDVKKLMLDEQMNDVKISKASTPKKTDIQDTENESGDYSHIRINKSCEENYLRQNLDQFDIEYMCRCLGLALMKHIESGKEKQHIMELMNLKENFSFFNSLFNVNIDFFNTFFNMENKMENISNLDKLDIKSNKENANTLNSDITTTTNTEKPISFVSHVRNKEDELTPITDGKEQPDTLETDMKMINEYFIGNIANGKYNKVNPNTKNILCQNLNDIKEVDSMEFVKENKLFTVEQNKEKQLDYINLLRQSIDKFAVGEQDPENNDDEEIYDNDEIEEKDEEENQDEEIKEKSNIEYTPYNNKDNKFTNYNLKDEEVEAEADVDTVNMGDMEEVDEDINEKQEEVFESGAIESNYIIDINDAEKLKAYLLKSVEIYDDDYEYSSTKINHKRYIPPPDPQSIYEFCANIMIMTKMEKEVIIICLIYLERLIFNTGILVNSRNWKRLIFTSLVIASKIWDDDSFENNHFAQVFPHLKIGEINFLERTMLELINYKVYVKCSEYFKYFFIIKSIALKYNFDGLNLIPISVEKMMKIQEYAYLMQKKLRSKYSHNNSAQF